MCVKTIWTQVQEQFNVTDSQLKRLPGATLMAIILILKFRLTFERKYTSYYQGIQYKISIWPIKN
jgi:hypothetical protein